MWKDNSKLYSEKQNSDDSETDWAEQHAEGGDGGLKRSAAGMLRSSCLHRTFGYRKYMSNGTFIVLYIPECIRSRHIPYIVAPSGD